MATYLAFHEVDDVDHWLSSPKREEVFGPLGITARTFKDPQGSKRVGMIVEIPDFAAFQEFMQTEEARRGPPRHSRGSRRGIGTSISQATALSPGRGGCVGLVGLQAVENRERGVNP
jgi:hypothetical protein